MPSLPLTEKRIYAKLKRLLPDSAHLTRIESVGEGIPDVHCCWNGHTCWLEIKQLLIRKDGKSCIFLRPAQEAWHRAYTQAGGEVWGLIDYKFGLALVDHKFLKKLGTAEVSLRQVGDNVITGDQLLDVLNGRYLINKLTNRP